MPELPEVETIVRGLKEKIAGKKVINYEVHDQKVADKNIKPLVPFTITNVTRRAKYLIFHTNTSHTLLCHLKMTGHFHYPTTAKEKQASTKYRAATFTFHDHSILTHNSIRRLGFIKRVTAKDLQAHLEKLGPEPLTITKNEFTSLLKKYPKGNIKVKLMDQQIIVGIGNIYAQEALYLAKINPKTTIHKITTAKLNNLHHHIQTILQNSIISQGTSIKNYTHLQGKGGYQDHLQIYQKDICPKNHQTKTITLAGRGTTYCPTCQK